MQWGPRRQDRNKEMHATNGNRPDIFKVGTVNLSSLHSQNHCLPDINCDVLLLQETRIKDTQKAAMRVILQRERGWNVHWGCGVPNARTGGVAVLTKPGYTATNIPPSSQDGAEAYSAGRLMITAVALGYGRTVHYVVNIYANSGTSESVVAQREALVETAFREAASLGNSAIATGGG